MDERLAEPRRDHEQQGVPTEAPKHPRRIDPPRLLSFWRDEEAVAAWRRLEEHGAAQVRGRTELFADYRLRIAGVVRDYGLQAREQAPLDSQVIHC